MAYCSVLASTLSQQCGNIHHSPSGELRALCESYLLFSQAAVTADEEYPDDTTDNNICRRHHVDAIVALFSEERHVRAVDNNRLFQIARFFYAGCQRRAQSLLCSS